MYTSTYIYVCIYIKRERERTWYPLGTAEELLNGIICEALVPTVIDFAGASPPVLKCVSS